MSFVAVRTLAIALLVLTSVQAKAHASVTEAELEAGYTQIHDQAVQLAGEPLDMPKRALILDEIYRDSDGNHAFPLIALHGALWGYDFFKVTGPIGNAIALRYFYDRKLMAEKKRLLNEFSVSFQKTNRSVFIDTYTNYYFTKQYGHEAGAEKYIHPTLLAALNEVHEAALTRQHLSPAKLKEVFQTALYYEQELTVGPNVHRAVQNFNCPVLTFFALKPVVHFAYFPFGAAFFFHDFSNQQERIRYATEAYDLAVHVGFDKVERTMRNYSAFR
jgi:hypothetical protein